MPESDTTQINLPDFQANVAAAVAAANKIVQDGLGGPEGYLTYLKIQALHDTHDQVIYVPTEASLPITEAKR